MTLEEQIIDYLLNHGPQSQQAIVEHVRAAQPNVSRCINNSTRIKVINTPVKLFAVGKQSRDVVGMIYNAIARFATLQSKVDPTLAKYGEREGYRKIIEQFTTDLEQLAILAMEVGEQYNES